MPDNVKYEEVLLEKLRVASMTAVNRLMLEDFSVDVMADILTDQLAVRLEKEVLGETLGRQTYTITQYHPRSWWQMFKDEHMPSWFIRKFPIKLTPHETTIRWTDIATFPFSSIKCPPDARGVAVVAYRDVDNDS